MKDVNRRAVLGFGLFAVAAPVLAACTTGSTGGAAANNSGNASAGAAKDAFPVTIKHAFGETVIKQEPKRPAGVGWGSADLSLLYGVVPVGVPAEQWGGDEHQSMPWVTEKLKQMGAGFGTDKAPKVYQASPDIPFVEIAKLQPDVIIAVHSGITKEDYAKLSDIAPTIAYPGQPWSTSWQDATTMVGRAFGQSAKAKDIVAKTDSLLKEQQSKNPDMLGKTFISAALSAGAADPLWVYGAADQRSKIMEDLGLKLATYVKDAGKKTNGQVLEPISPEHASELVSDVIINWAPADKSKEELEKDPAFAQIPPVKAGHLLSDTNKDLAYSLTVGTPLGLEWGIPKFVPELVSAIKS